MSRSILHVDMDAFFASVEQLDHPEWRGRPVIVGSAPDARGVVAAASYEARRYGVHSAMPSREAGRRCPDGIFTPPRGARYAEVSSRIMAIFERFTPLVEPLSIDEAFLDVTGARGLFGDGPAIAARIKQTIREETGLTASVGVAGNKFLAKLASELEKPDGLTVVPDGDDAVRAFLAPLAVDRIWGVGAKRAAELARLGIRTVADLQRMEAAALARQVGVAAAAHLKALAFGLDARPVETGSETKSISREHTFDTDSRDVAAVRAVLLDLAEDVGRQLRGQGLLARLGVLKIRWAGFETRTRQRPFARAVDDDFALRRMADSLLAEADLTRPVRLIGFGTGNLTAQPEPQGDLFAALEGRQREVEVTRAVDALRQRLGPGSIRRGGHIDNSHP